MSSHIKAFTPPLSPELLLSCNFFELYPFDGGGSFIHRTMVGSVDDAEITDAIINKQALASFGPLDKIDFLCFDRWSTIEQSCWINRMYFIVPLARQAALTGDRSIAELVKSIILRFGSIYPPPANEEEVRKLNRSIIEARDRDYNMAGPGFDAPICYQWFDFQPASRIIHITHAVWFLLKMGIFSEEESAAVDHMLREHARVIFQANDVGSAPRPGNHEALRALALLSCGLLFQDEPEAALWIDEGLRFCEAHIFGDLMEDGMGTDLSPSYHFFETWICRDADIYARRCGHPFSPAAQERLNRAYDLCRLFQLPNGLTPVISDGYPLDMNTFCKTLPPVPEQPAEQRVTLMKSGFAIRKSHGAFALLDASPLLSRFAHYHAGKQAVTLWFENRPFVEEGGCCNYDDPAFSEFFKTANAHASLLVEGKGDSLLEGRYCWHTPGTCRLTPWNGNTVSSTETSPEWGRVVWTRMLSVDDSHAEIHDIIQSTEGKEWSLLFPLPPEVAVSGSGCSLQLTNGEVTVEVTSPLPIRLRQNQCVRNFRIVPTLCLEISGKGDTDLVTTFGVSQR